MIEVTDKQCGRCGLVKPLDAFWKNKYGKHGRHSICRKCKHVHTQKQKFKAYGITEQDYNTMLKAQDYKCAICGISDVEYHEYFCVDHCHTTLKVRGLLCRSCNCMLGMAHDNVDKLLRAVDYLTADQLDQV